MPYRRRTQELVETIVGQAKERNCLSGFTIGNTAKPENHGLYFTPLRTGRLMVSAGVIVYSAGEAVEVAKIADGHVRYILVDAETKIPNTVASGESISIEGLIRRNVRESTLWFYKANDLSVDAVDGLLAQLTNTDLRGVYGRRVAILGAGNIGFKLALRLVERGAHVVITRRNPEILSHLVRAINCVKSAYTQAVAEGLTDNAAAAAGAEFLIGTSSGVALITPAMIESLAPNAMIIDVGKGVLFPEAIALAHAKGMRIFRLDITAAFEGLVHHLWAAETLVEHRMGRRQWHGEAIVSGGFLGGADEIVVDNVHNPNVIYGIADGQGDFVRPVTDEQQARLDRLDAAMRQDRS
jgi:NAD(P)-dependent dehydrogenase (short-subunit alcohol dehydrogenase family)